MKNTMKSLNVNRMHSLENRIANLMNHGSKTALVMFGRLQKAVQTIKPDTMLFSRPSTATAGKTNQFKKLANHREENVKPIDQTGCYVYDIARWAVASKINGARMRGVTEEHNVYLQYRNDMIQTASLAIMESFQTEIDYDVQILDCAEFSFNYEYEYTDTELRDFGRKACGRYAYQIEKRAKEGTPIEHVSNCLKTSAFERHITDRESVSSFKRDLLTAVYAEKRIRPETRDNIIEHLKTGKLTDRDRIYLKQICIKSGLISTDVTGKHYITF